MAAVVEVEKGVGFEINPQIDYLIAQRSKVIAKLSTINSSIDSTNTIIRNQQDDEKNYIKERGGDLKLLLLQNSNEQSNTSEQTERLEIGLKISSQKQGTDSRRQNREKQGQTDYSVILDADVFSAARKGKPVDKSIVGVGDAAEQVNTIRLLQL